MNRPTMPSMESLISDLEDVGVKFADVVIEEKVVRHVRTPAGVARFKQPIGSVIVAKGRLNNIMEIDSEYDGWDKYRTNHGEFYVGKDRGKWVVTDPSDNDLSSHASQERALEWLDDYASGPMTKPASKPAAKPASKPASNMATYDAGKDSKWDLGRALSRADAGNKITMTMKDGTRVSGYYKDHVGGLSSAPKTVTVASSPDAKRGKKYNQEDIASLEVEKGRSISEMLNEVAQQEEGADGPLGIYDVDPQDKKPASTPRASKEDLDHLFGKTPVSKAPNKPATRSTGRSAASKPASRPQTAKAPAKPAGKRAATSGGGIPGYTSPSNLSKDRNSRLGVLTPAPSEFDGWEKYEDGDVVRYIGKVDGEWVVNDENDNMLMSGKNKAALRKEMQNAHASFDDGSPVRLNPRKVTRGQHAKAPRPDTIAINNLEHAETEQQIRAHAAAYGYAIPADAKNVMLNMNPEDPESRIYAWYVQGKGAKPQLRQKPETAAANAENKWARIEAFNEDVPQIDNAIKSSNLASDDDMMVIALMRKYGARVGSDKSSRQKDDGEPRGMTELSRKDVSIDGDVVTLDYPGKKYNAKTGAGWQHYEIDDPQLVAAFKQRMAKMKSDNELFFPDVTATTTKMRTRAITGGVYTNHDYRRKFATEQATALVKLRRPQPKTKEEAATAIKEIGAFVDELLNDKNQAIKSYIDPRVFDKWNKIGA